MTREKSYFKEEERCVSHLIIFPFIVLLPVPVPVLRVREKKRNIIIVVVAVLVVVAIIVIVVPVVVITQKADDSEPITSDHWCGLMLPAGVNMSEQTPRLISGRKTCDISGSCWTKEQCYPCFDGPNRDRVGNINDIPVCCPTCTRDGLHIQWNKCDC